MNETSSTPALPSPIPISPDGIERDWLLQRLVSFSLNGAEFGLTVCCGGLIISGMVARPQGYFDAMGQEFGSYYKDTEEGKRIAQQYSDLGQEVYSSVSADKPPTILHLRDAKVWGVSSGPVPAGNGAWWRCRISAVDSFSLGIMSR